MGLLLNRIHLPTDDRKHMPPVDKTQLTAQEAAILYAWIKDGAPFVRKSSSWIRPIPCRTIAARLLKSNDIETYDFPAADDKKISSLNSNYRTIRPLARILPALAIDFYGATFFQPKQLQEFSAIKDQIVSLNLEKMPVTDKDLPNIAVFHNLGASTSILPASPAPVFPA